MTTQPTNPTTLARQVIGAILDGQSPNGATPQQLGRFSECYSEMCRAHQVGGTEAARKIFKTYAEGSGGDEYIRLVSGDPQSNKRKIWLLADLYKAKFKPLKPVVPGLIFVGLNGLGARPKLGKSWFLLQIAGAVGSGGVVLGQRVTQRRVLYLALEDSERRIQDRSMGKLKLPANATVDFAFEWRPLAEGGLVDLMTTVNENDYGLVVVDTISRALGKADQLDQAEMNVAFGQLQRFALDKEIAIVLCDHHKKAITGDPIDDFLGATSKGAVLDVALGIYRERSSRTAILKITGRDVGDQEISIKFDNDTCCWQPEGGIDGVRVDSVQADILLALKELGGSATITKIARWMDKPPSNISREMNELVNKNKVIRGKAEGKEVPYKLVKSENN